MAMRALTIAGALAIAACAPRPLPLSPFDHAAAGAETLARVSYQLRWRGAVVGDATLAIVRRRDAVTIDRRDTLRLRRGDASVTRTLRIVVEANAALVPRALRWWRDELPEQHAERRTDGWFVDGTWVADAAAVPSELVPLLAARDHGFVGPVLLPGDTLLVGAGEVTALAEGQHLARVTIAGVVRRSVVTLATDGLPSQIIDDTGVTASRVDALPPTTASADVLALGALPVAGAPGPTLALTIVDGATLALPELAGQRVVATDTAELTVALAPPPDLDGAIARITAMVADAIAPSLAMPATPATGDCTTFALELHAALGRAGIAAQLVTGYLLVDGTLWRHRWVVAWTGRAWVQVDATQPQPGADHLALRLHGTTAADLWAADAAFIAISAARYLPAARPDHAS